ncbi:outer membrane beta-barrel protein [Haliangium sp.]|uniref:outer membrane beta-barrel protein n=1 Tax=Haliangium sp. TaxID=2663208 RepID=UPI003D14F6A0
MRPHCARCPAPARPPRYAPRPVGLIAAVGATLALLCAAPASADTHASRGFFAEVGAGATQFLPDAADYAKLGPALEFRVGYDLFSWLSVGGYAGASIHEATVPPPPVGEYFQLYHGGADLRLGYRFGRIGAYVDGHAGVSMISTNVLEKVAILEPGQRFSLSYAAGAMVEYQLENRHYAVGLAGQWLAMPDFDSTQGVSSRLYLRYTY